MQIPVADEKLQKALDEDKILEEKALENEVTTKVTTIAEEKRQGNDIKVPSAEELIARISVAHIKEKRLFNELFPLLSARGKNRVMNALLDLPMEKVRSTLKDKQEYETFLVGQNALNYKFTILTHHIAQEAKKTKVSENNTDNNNNEKQGD